MDKTAVRYIGPIPVLKNKTAQVVDGEANFGDQSHIIRAQFDDQNLFLNGVRMCAGWHPFKREYFEEV